MKYALALAMFLFASASAVAQMALPSAKAVPTARVRTPQSRTVPQPIAIPQELSPPQEAYAAFPDSSAPAPTGPTTPSACQLRLEKIAAFHPLPTLVGPGECGATDAVLLNAVVLPDKTQVTITPPATVRCQMAEATANWIRDDIVPAALKLGSPVRTVDNFGSYECRGRNRVRGATLSEHGRADALDVRAFKLADGRTIGLTDVNVDKDWRNAIRATVCARFSTVLGPGSDGEHEQHIHLDLAERRNNYKICEWEVRVPAVQAEAASPSPAEAALPDKTGPEQNIPAAISLADIPLPRPRPRETKMMR